MSSVIFVFFTQTPEFCKSFESLTVQEKSRLSRPKFSGLEYSTFDTNWAFKFRATTIVFYINFNSPVKIDEIQILSENIKEFKIAAGTTYTSSIMESGKAQVSSPFCMF